MVFFIGNVRNELKVDLIYILDFLSNSSLHLYDKITHNLIIMLRIYFGKSRSQDKFLV